MTTPQCLRFSSRSTAVMDSKQGDSHPFYKCLLWPLLPCASFLWLQREESLGGEGRKGDSLHQHCPSPKGDLISLPVLLYFCWGMGRRDQCPWAEATPLAYGMLTSTHLGLGRPTVSTSSRLIVREGMLVAGHRSWWEYLHHGSWHCQTTFTLTPEPVARHWPAHQCLGPVQQLVVTILKMWDAYYLYVLSL